MRLAPLIVACSLLAPALSRAEPAENPADRIRTQKRFDRAQFIADVNSRLNMLSVSLNDPKTDLTALATAANEAQVLLGITIESARSFKEEAEARVEERLRDDLKAMAEALQKKDVAAYAEKLHDAGEAMKTIQTLLGVEG